MWLRCRFRANPDDFRPVIFPPPGPYWCTGYAGDDSYAVVVAYIPEGQTVWQYWPEAVVESIDETEEIVFTDRFPKPGWWDGEGRMSNA